MAIPRTSHISSRRKDPSRPGRPSNDVMALPPRRYLPHVLIGVAMASSISLGNTAAIHAQEAAESVVDDQDATHEVAVTVVTIAEGGATLGQLTRVEAGLRRGIDAEPGIRYVSAADTLAPPDIPEEVQLAIDELEPIADMVRTGSASAALARARAATALFEANLEVVPRAALVDAYMLEATAQCRLRHRRECREGFSRVVTFREDLEYDAERYPPNHQRDFVAVKAHLIEHGSRGSIRITTEPPGAEVFVDGRSYGPSPAMAEGLIVGDHYATASAVGYQRGAARVTVDEAVQETAQIEILRSDRALLLEQDLGRIRSELGEARAGRNISGLSAYLFANQVIFAVVQPRSVELAVDLYLYDLRTRFLLRRQEVAVADGSEGGDMARDQVAVLYREVDTSGAIEAPAPPVLVDGPSPFWQRWWFWTAVGVVVASGVVAGVAFTGGDEVSPPADGWSRFEGRFQ